MDIIRLYRDYGIHYATEGHKHTRPGWVNTECPFCTGNQGMHLGYDMELDRFVCWRCGGKGQAYALHGLLNLDYYKVYELIKQYGGVSQVIIKKREKSVFSLPSNCSALTTKHSTYLTDRCFDAAEIVRKYGILSSGITSMLDGVDYRNRIIIPIYWQGHMVSFDSRDVTGKRKDRYKAAPVHREVIEHKRILYGRQEHWTDVGICVEGYTDVWRLGDAAFSTSGIKFMPAQVRAMAKQFRRIAVMYDDDPQAIKQANKLVAELKFRNVDAFRVDIVGDPGDLPQEEADYIVKHIIN